MATYEAGALIYESMIILEKTRWERPKKFQGSLWKLCWCKKTKIQKLNLYGGRIIFYLPIKKCPNYVLSFKSYMIKKETSNTLKGHENCDLAIWWCINLISSIFVVPAGWQTMQYCTPLLSTESKIEIFQVVPLTHNFSHAHKTLG